VLAHLQAQATRDDEGDRADWKGRLMANIARRDLDREDRREWLRLLDWLLQLPRERNAAVWQRVRALLREKEGIMPFVDDITEQEQLAEQRGRVAGLLKGIQALLRVQLPEQEPALMARLGQVEDPELLGRALEAAAAADLAQLNALLP
jgi:hypothetical protein